ncbi:MAG: cell division protein ZapA [Alteromonadaceae bacterium]|nr:MAG: cell division protein ZapA [Alteromonadaceae bacterium]
MTNAATVNINILGKDYQIACPQDERARLDRAATELDARMRAVRANGNIIGLERIAVMAALNLCHELQTGQENDCEGKAQASLERIAEKLELLGLDELKQSEPHSSEPEVKPEG